MSEKTEKASAFKLKKSKEQGIVSKSAELNTSVFLLVLLGVAIALWPSCASSLKTLLMRLISLSGRITFSVETLCQLQALILNKFIWLWLPLALAGMFTIILTSIMQTGFVWSGLPLVPDFKRLDIIKGFKRLTSSKVIFDAAKNSVKLCVVCLCVSLSIKHEFVVFLKFIKTSPQDIATLFIALLSKIIFQVLLILLVLALIDTLYTRWKFAKDNRMSRHELKDEHRQREGCPKVKAKIKQLQHQLRQKSASLAQVKTADVVITNPTHLAIALKYDRGVMPAPKIVCKAQGENVIHVKNIAVRHQITIVENKSLARLLFATSELNTYVHRDHFPQVAMIFREIYRQRDYV